MSAFADTVTAPVSDPATITPATDVPETALPSSEPAAEATTAPSAEPTAEPQYVSLKYGDDGSSVKDLQKRLSETGYYTGTISGRYREGTRTAIKSFQTDYDLTPTGVADESTQALLYSVKYKTLRRGSTGDEVTNLQTIFTALGYYDGKISGKFLDGTLTAVKKYQKDNGLIETGIVNAYLYETLINIDLEAYATPAPSPTPVPDTTYKRELSYGLTGNDVLTLQNRLYDLGYYSNALSGKFLGNTRRAVKAFQEHNAIEADGIVGETTWTLIFSDEARSATDDAAPTPEPTPVPYAITVDVNNQLVKVYARGEDGSYDTLYKTFLCSSGTKSNPSPVGTFVLNGRTARWSFFPEWGSYAQFWTRINSSIAFHSLIYNSVNTSDLSVKSYNKLGSRASHGCIRLTVADARWIYNNCGAGTVVTITESLPKDEELVKLSKPGSLNKKNMLPYTTAVPEVYPDYDPNVQPPQPFRKLKAGMTGEDVYWLQCRLAELGYYTGTITGGYYAGTTAAVKAYQRDNGLSVDGIAAEKTLKKIYAEVLATAAPDTTAVPTIEPTMTPSPTIIMEPADTLEPSETVDPEDIEIAPDGE